MNPDVVAAVEMLRDEKTLPEETAGRLLRIARGQLVSAHAELRAALYAGVLLLTAGVGMLLKENLTRIGPLAVALGIAGLVLACAIWVSRHLTRFSWGEATSAHLAFDYILLLGVLLGAADLAYVEWQFTPLGDHWPAHLLLVSLAMGGIAIRCDSRLIFSLSLSTFAAWRGVSISVLGPDIWRFLRAPAALRADAIGCGLLFLLIGALARRWKRKAHFEPVAAHLGWIAILLALISGAGTVSGEELLFTLALTGCGVGLAFLEARRRRFSLVAVGMLAAAIGGSLLFHRADPDEAAAAVWYVIVSLGLLAGLFFVHRRLRGKT